MVSAPGIERAVERWNLESRTSDPDDLTTAFQQSVAFLDDNDEFREVAALALGDHGFDVRGFASGPELLTHFVNGGRADVIILDWKLPNETGLQVMERLHLAGVNAPIIFLTNLPARIFENLALERGAVDFVDKARGVEILVKRLRHIVEGNARQKLQPSKQMRQGSLILKLETMRAYWKDVDIGLTVSEFKILRVLVEGAGDYVGYREIYDCIHHVGFVAGDGDNGFRGNVRTILKRIRNKFKQADPAFANIENYAAFGYRWNRE